MLPRKTEWMQLGAEEGISGTYSGRTGVRPIIPSSIGPNQARSSTILPWEYHRHPTIVPPKMFSASTITGSFSSFYVGAGHARNPQAVDTASRRVTACWRPFGGAQGHPASRSGNNPHFEQRGYRLRGVPAVRSCSAVASRRKSDVQSRAGITEFVARRFKRESPSGRLRGKAQRQS